MNKVEEEKKNMVIENKLSQRVLRNLGFEIARYDNGYEIWN